MRTRRLPTGGLAALAALLAALAVVVVAGAPTPRTIVERVRVTTTRPTTSVVDGAHRHRSSKHAMEVDRDLRRSSSEEVSIPTTRRAAAPSSSTTTTTAPPRPVTTPPRSVTTTTRPVSVGGADQPISRDGTFAPGQTSVTTRLGSVRAVAVSVRGGIEVTLSVTCGLTVVTATSVSRTTVQVPVGASACVAKFAVPAGSPQPTTWQLVTW
jgi:hypothetical protein